MKKNSSYLLLALIATPLSSAVHAEVSANITLTNDYRFRGISQSNEKIAVQGGFDWAHESGLYAGTWASSVDFFPTNSALDDGASIEFDLWAGYGGKIYQNITYDVTLYYYQYPGDDIEQDFFEIGLGLNQGPVRLAYWYANDYLGLGLDNQYVEVEYTTALYDELGLILYVGYSFGEVYEDPALLGLEEYFDYSVGVTREIADVSFLLSYLDTTIDEGFAVGNGHLANQDAVVLSITKTF